MHQGIQELPNVQAHHHGGTSKEWLWSGLPLPALYIPNPTLSLTAGRPGDEVCFTKHPPTPAPTPTPLCTSIPSSGKNNEECLPNQLD